jgi:hypothetical protein
MTSIQNKTQLREINMDSSSDSDTDNEMVEIKNTNANNTNNNTIKPTFKNYEKESPQIQLNKMVKLFYNNNPYSKTNIMNHELEVKFSTRGIKPLTKIDYDNVIRKIKSLGFNTTNELGNYFMRIHNEFLDAKTGKFKLSRNMRTEINGFYAIQEYCKVNDIRKIRNNENLKNSVKIVDKSSLLIDNTKNLYLRDVVFQDFNFSVSYKTEKNLNYTEGKVIQLINNWEKSKKTFRYINRVTFKHPDYPINVDISIVKSSTKEKTSYDLIKTYKTDESGVFTNPESFEIELEVDNTLIGPGTEFNTPEIIENAIRKVIKFVMSGLQGTNYPVSIIEQKTTMQSYMKLIHNDSEYNIEKEPNKYKINSNSFIGPSSYTLQMQNIVPINENMNIPNIRNNFVVTEKADGERNLMYISDKGKIYLINTNMNVIFTGAVTKDATLLNSLLDGELILHNKFGDFINLYAAFDIYYLNKVDIRSYGFIPVDSSEIDKKIKYRYPILKSFIKNLKPESVVTSETNSPIKIVSKDFYPININASSDPKSQNNSIFTACNYILKKVDEDLFEYNTDGLIFTPALFGVGSDKIGKAGPITKTTWDYSFKWKPAEFNTVDFLVTTKKSNNGDDVVTPIFEDGINMNDVKSLSQYKTMILRCGFDERKHGFINPCQDILDDKLPEYDDMDNDNSYKAVQFYPTDPYDANAGICNIMLSPDGNGVLQMKTEEGEVFEDNTIVEFKYDLDREGGWRWVPIRVRSDKTAELKQSLFGIGKPNYGNAYHVANSNWKSIHNPITKRMISTGLEIPEDVFDEDVYYNRFISSNETRSLRDFHNLYVKNLLITSVSKKGDTLIDLACGKAGDLSKWIKAKLSFVFGIDISKDNLENRIDGACTRFLKKRREFKHMPYALFVNGDSRHNIRNGSAMLNDKAIQITKAIFGEGSKDEKNLGNGVIRQYGKGQEGFNVCSCQFAIHYFTENIEIFKNFMRNIAECTALNGYFIGTSYDGKLVFNMLKNNENVEIFDNGVKIWEVKKQYNKTVFEDNSSSLGYKIDVFQESINKMISEYLVNYDYLNRVMEDFGFKLITREEAQTLGLPEGSGLFSELFMNMQEEIKRNKFKEKEYGSALKMNSFEKKISFLNRYFVYKKIRNVNASKVKIEEYENENEDGDEVDLQYNEKVYITKENEREPEKKKAKKLHAKILLVPATESLTQDIPQQTNIKSQVNNKVTKPKKPRLIIHDE